MNTDTPRDVHDVLAMIGKCVLGTWLEGFIREAYSVSEVPIEVHLGDGDHIFPDIGRRVGEPRVMMMLGPGLKQMQTVGSGTVPVVAALDDPVDSVRFAMAADELSFLDALRLQTRYAAGNHLYFSNPAVLLVERGIAVPAREVLAAVMAHLGLHMRPGDGEAVLERFGGPAAERWTVETALARRVPLYLRLDKVKQVISAEQAKTVREALSPLVLGAISRDIGPIVWSSKVFLYGDRPNEIVPPVADITGGARIIFYGPYFHLPPGVWRARLIIAFSSETRGTPFRVVMLARDKPIVTALIKPTDGGAFEGEFTFRHRDPEQHIEVHFRNDEGTIEGHVALGQLTFTQVATP